MAEESAFQSFISETAGNLVDTAKTAAGAQVGELIDKAAAKLNIGPKPASTKMPESIVRQQAAQGSSIIALQKAGLSMLEIHALKKKKKQEALSHAKAKGAPGRAVSASGAVAISGTVLLIGAAAVAALIFLRKRKGKTAGPAKS